MQFSVTFRNVASSDAVKMYARERLEKVRKFFPEPIAVDVVLSTERYNHCVDVNLRLHNGFVIAGHEAAENMYSSIDMVAAKIESQVRRYKDKLRDHNPKHAYQPIELVHQVLEEPLTAEGYVVDHPAPPVIGRTERFHAEPLTAAQAVEELNRLSRSFLVFRDADHGHVSVIYRRDAGGYGLIDTGGLD